MAKKALPSDKRQMSLFDDPILPPVTLTYRQELIEQIRRDVQTLKMDPEFWQPSREFYETRIVSFREAVCELDGGFVKK